MGSTFSRRQQYPYPPPFPGTNGAAGFPNMFPQQQAFPQFGGPPFGGQGPGPYSQFNPGAYAATSFPNGYAPSGFGGGGGQWVYEERQSRRRRRRRRRSRSRSRSRDREYEDRSRSIPPAPLTSLSHGASRTGGRPAIHTPYPTHVPSLAPSTHAPADQVPIPGRDISQVLHPPTPVTNPSVYGPPGSQHGATGAPAAFNGQLPPGFVPNGAVPSQFGAPPNGFAYQPHPSGIGHLPAHPSLLSPLPNALPPPPRDLYELEPYKSVLDMKSTGTLLSGSTASALGGIAVPVTQNTKTKVKSKSHTGHSSSGGGGLGNLFRSFSTATRHRKAPPPPAPERNVILVPVFRDREADRSQDATTTTASMPVPVTAQ